MVREQGDASAPIRIGPDEATFPLLRGGSLVLRREERVATFTTPFRISDEELAHPHLAPVGAIFALWAGRESLHAGAFVADGRAWGVLGTREAGKSTLLAALHAAGLVALPYAPAPMRFLNGILGRPDNERPFLLVAVGYPAPDAQVPALPRKPSSETIDFV